jgi:hypothetical protein
MLSSLVSFVHDHVDAQGVQVISVRPERRKPAFSYTIGRHRNQGAPELLIIGIPGPLGAAVLAEASLSLSALSDSEREPWRLKKCGIYVRAQALPRPKVEKLMLWAVRYYGHSQFPALEVVSAEPSTRRRVA